MSPWGRIKIHLDVGSKMASKYTFQFALGADWRTVALICGSTLGVALPKPIVLGDCYINPGIYRYCGTVAMCCPRSRHQEWLTDFQGNITIADGGEVGFTAGIGKVPEWVVSFY